MMTDVGRTGSDERVSTDFSAVTDSFGGAIDDPFPLYAEMRRMHPVMEGDILRRFGIPSQADFTDTGRPVYTLFKYTDVMEVLKDADTYTSGLLNEGLGQFLGGFVLTGMDGAEHRLARKLLAPGFSSAAVSRWEEKVARVVRDEFTRPLAPRGRADLMADFFLPASIRLIYEVIGFPRDRDRAAQFASWGMRILMGPMGGAGAAAQALRAAEQFHDNCLAIVARRRADGGGGDDLIGLMLRAEQDGATLDDAEITLLLRQLLPAAFETTARSIGSLVVVLLNDAALLERVRSNRSLVRKAINEGMRWCTPSQFLARQCARDVEIRGVRIAQGSALSLASGSANRDEDVFDDPDRFDLDRNQRPNVAFGFGVHACIGLQVAKMEMAGMVNALLDDLPGLRFDPAVPKPKIAGAQLRGPRRLDAVWD